MPESTKTRASWHRKVRRCLLLAASAACYLAGLGFLLLGPIAGPMLLGYRTPTGVLAAGPPLFEVVLLDLALGASSFGIFWLATCIDPAFKGRTTVRVPVLKLLAMPLPRPRPRSMLLWIAGAGLHLLATAMLVLGFQEALLPGQDGYMWLVDAGIAMCSLPVSWYSRLALKEAWRPRRSGGRAAAGGVAASRRAPIGGGTLYALCWLARLVGSVVGVLGALLFTVTFFFPHSRSGLVGALGVELAIVAVGATIFRLGILARDAARRRFGLATPLSASALAGLGLNRRVRVRVPSCPTESASVSLGAAG